MSDHPPRKSWRPEELLEQAVSTDEREWVPVADGAWVRPLLFDTVGGAWVNVTRLRTTSIVSRHAHPCPVHGFVIKGQWHYAERDWQATAGSYVYEPPGDVHTLVGDGDESLTLFWISGTLIELDDTGRPTGYADVFTRIEQARSHFENVGLGADYVDRFVR